MFPNDSVARKVNDKPNFDQSLHNMFRKFWFIFNRQNSHFLQYSGLQLVLQAGRSST